MHIGRAGKDERNTENIEKRMKEKRKRGKVEGRRREKGEKCQSAVAEERRKERKQWRKQVTRITIEKREGKQKAS